ncbi:hypothetical protein AAHE18_03G028800 [Arachis hypogaea]
MEEGVEQRPFYDPFSLNATEQSFYDALNDVLIDNINLPLSPNEHPLDVHHQGGTTSSSSSGSNSGNNNDNQNNNNPVDENSSEFLKPSVSPDTFTSGDHAFQFNSHAISQHDSNASYVTNFGVDSDSVSQFRRGLEEASKFLPPGPQLVTGFETTPAVAVPIDELKGDKAVGLKGRKNHEREEWSDDTEEGRSNKHSATSSVVDESELSEMFDKVLLSIGAPMCFPVNNEVEKASNPSTSNGGKGRPKRQGKKKETIDLRTLLVLCAQAVSACDNRTATELLKQIRQHSTPSGDATQRTAHYFANGLEARLHGDGTGTQGFYTYVSTKRLSAAEFLKAYKVFMSACPFSKFANFFANKMIMKAAQNAETLHIIDFGILYGFQWPILIKFLSDRETGPLKKLKITGIEFPQPGFRPAERLHETGRRLANYCERFKVPFEYNAIASRNWETIQVEDFKIESNEFLAVNCHKRFENLMDETIEVNSPRDAVLQLIKKINPDIFVQAIVNGSYNAPFFATRFREALFHFSAIYDMCDAVIPRDNEKRMKIEREIIGREVLNVVACEGFERIDRPETYKQWQARNTRAGFKQLPLNEELMAKFSAKLKEWYHKDFVFDEDGNWMLQGWKGRVLYASTCWVPA